MRIEDSPSKNSAAQPIRQRRTRNDDEDARHKATLARSLELSNGGAVPVSVSEVHSECGLTQLLHDPGTRRMVRYIEVQNASPVVSQDKETVEHSEGDGGH